MNTYTLFWLTGYSELVKGNTPAEAMNNAGIGAGAIPALDFWAKGDERKNYVWNKPDHRWNEKS